MTTLVEGMRRNYLERPHDLTEGMRGQPGEGDMSYDPLSWTSTDRNIARPRSLPDPVEIVASAPDRILVHPEHGVFLCLPAAIVGAHGFVEYVRADLVGAD